jgi:wobble nucleotide-excising tRNase
MIERIDIENFGSFNGFAWDASVRDSGGNIRTFKKLNILYGRNYSGKTTLSRVVRSLQTGVLPEKYESPSFLVSTSSGTVSHADISAADHDIRVYNRDFVDDHLSFLRDSEGRITPFAVIGETNTAIEKEIAEHEEQLGSTETKTGLRHELAEKEEELRVARQRATAAQLAIREKLINKANSPQGGIKHNPLYRDANYDIRKIKADIKIIRAQSLSILPETERQKKEALLGESALPDIKRHLAFTPAISRLAAEATELLSKRISPSEPIQELLDDAVLQAWVKQGIPHHRGKRRKCGFCGGAIPEDLWTKLDAHFSKESTDLEASLRQHIEAVQAEKKLSEKVIIVERAAFYSALHTAFDNAEGALVDELEKYQASLDTIIGRLHDRQLDIFGPQPALQVSDNSPAILAGIRSVNDLIERNNSITDSLQGDQDAARRDLRLSEVAHFAQDIGLDAEEKKVVDLKAAADTIETAVAAVRESVDRAQTRVEELRTQLKDERRGAEKVNEYLNNYFGHESLRLTAVQEDDGSAFKFQIMRGDSPAYNLSEGECSLVSFCYFVAKLDDTESSGKKLTIYIDDPVSSLDSNHIFFVFSLIESLIAAPDRDAQGKAILDHNNRQYRYEQLFVSTHNLEFLKYLKKLSRPKRNSEHFLVVCRNGRSAVELMPEYLRSYVTEFNQLFGELYLCIDPANAESHHHCFYNFGNNLRRFLEAFLFFKFTFTINGQEDYNRRVRMFFAGEPGNEALVQRLTNEYSHLGELFEKSMLPVDHAEISKVAGFVLKRIKERDGAQFQCLLESIGEVDPWS